MNDYQKFKASLDKDIKESSLNPSNPLAERLGRSNIALSDYSKSTQRPKFDSDIAEILEVVRVLNNLAPRQMPVYNFNIDEINGERYYRPDGTLLLIREWDGDIIRDYYSSTEEYDGNHVSRILEHDKHTGRLRAKIEPITRVSSRITTNITIFDEKINNKYTLMQLSDGGIVNNITEFTGKGKAFQTLFRNITNFKPARYLEGKENKNKDFEMVDCIFDSKGAIARIKRYTNKKEVCIDYTETTKNVSVKTKDV